MTIDYRKELQNLLRKLFQFDSADLDFGIYKIMNQKRKQIEEFIQNDLIISINEEYKSLLKISSNEIESEIDEIKNEIFNKLGVNAISSNGEIDTNFKDAPLIKDYLIKKDLLVKQKTNEQEISEVFSHIFHFFSRYFDEGDFISKRRYGRNSKYVIPYNGEEVLLHWASNDQYYIKTTEWFSKYSFKNKNKNVNFIIIEASQAAGNVKEDATKFFVLGDKEIQILNDDIDIFFSFRSLTDEETKKFGKNTTQEKINDLIFLSIKDYLKVKQQDNLIDIELLKKHLFIYTKRNTSDYFIHRNLKSFLEKELDFYIKNEVLVYDFKEKTSFDLFLLKSKVIKKISDKIITFLAQIEDFQKILWEKKKFVISTEYCITLDNINEKFYSEIIENKEQLKEWKRLFSFDINGKLKEDKLNLLDFIEEKKSNSDDKITLLKKYGNLLVDTRFFKKEFKYQLLSEYDNLDDKITGILIKSDNFHALNLMIKKYKNKIKCCYIDPPYNAKSSEILYKNTFKHSSWLTLMENRLELSKSLLKQDDGVLIIAIDENEQERLGLLLDRLYNSHEKVCVTVVHNPAGIQGNNFSYIHEFAYFIFPTGREIIGETERDEGLVSPLRDWGNESERKNAKTCFYPIYVNRQLEIIGFGDVCKDDFHPKKSNIEEKNGIISIFPIDKNGIERKWVFNRKSVENIKQNLFCEKVNDVYIIKRKKTLFKYRTVWDDKKYYANIYGSKLLRNIIGDKRFTFPKSVYLVKDSIESVTQKNKDAIILDFFAGSGTTGHAILKLNNEDAGNRKFILIEMGQYFDSVLKERILKCIYSDNWENGKPLDNNGAYKQIIKYQSLEQYEDTLHNIIFIKDNAIQKTLDKIEDYFLNYILHYESEKIGSNLSESIFSKPFNYKLQIFENNEQKNVNIDLIETFNYLLGLHIDSIKTYTNDRTYRVIFGNLNDSKIVVIWRDTEKLDLKNDKEFIENTILRNIFPDKIYINCNSFLKNAVLLDEKFKTLMGF